MLFKFNIEFTFCIYDMNELCIENIYNIYIYTMVYDQLMFIHYIQQYVNVYLFYHIKNNKKKKYYTFEVDTYFILKMTLLQ